MKLHRGPPYQRWQLELLTAFHTLHVERGTDGRRYKPGVLAKVVMEKDNAESYVITCQYDINYNQGAYIGSWYRVVESLIWEMEPQFKRCPMTQEPMGYDSLRRKANCGIRIRVKLNPVTTVSQI